MKKLAKKYKDFLVGFEVECFINPSKTLTTGAIRNLIKSLYPKIDIGSDGSLEPEADDNDCYDEHENYKYENTDAIEIRTPPLPINEAIPLVKKIFSIIRRYGFTNSTASIHMNFSTLNKKYQKNFNPALFAAHPIWREIGQAFDRLDNEFCINHADSYRFNNRIDLYGSYSNLVADCLDKYSAVNLGYLNDNNTGRIEIRSMGNANYHKRFKDIKTYTNKILNLFIKTSKESVLPSEIKV